MSDKLNQKIQTLNLKKDPVIIDLVKKTAISLEKKGINLDKDAARVALCMDFSGSMYWLIKNGTVSELTQRSLAQGIVMDDDGDIEVFGFGSDAKYIESINADNYVEYCEGVQRDMPDFGSTYYHKAINLIVSHYDRIGYDKPVYVIFVTDGDTFSKTETEEVLKAASGKPIFWQFIGIGQDEYDPNQVDAKVVKKPGVIGRFLGAKEKEVPNTKFEFLVKLDEMEGRVVDNAGFFAVKDPKSMSAERMYDLMHNEYPEWLKEVRAKGILR